MKHRCGAAFRTVLWSHDPDVLVLEPMLQKEVCPPVPDELSWPNQFNGLFEVEKHAIADGKASGAFPLTAMLDHVKLPDQRADYLCPVKPVERDVP